MNTHEAARRLLARSALILQEARYLEGKEAWSLVIRRCQEAVELALKAALLWAGIEVPRVHDVGPILKEHTGRFPVSFQRLIPPLASISRALRAERELSFYGDEQSGTPPELLYTEVDAQEALKNATEVLNTCQNLIALREADDG
ncbi:MAG: HEPN domain-containing protein [Deltaproteobacteria bacterium]|nr:HEPN domain-containing protein [Deltaproteobacteria bacterium]